jgi:isopentenyl phosphate kinase
MVTVLKLGGSVITDKHDPETIDEDALDRCAEAIATADEDVIVVHGGGSFGHHHARAHDVTTEAGTHDAEAIDDIHAAMCRLNDAVCDELRVHGETPVPVHPLSLAHRDADGSLSVPVAHLETMRDEGFVPVLHGDVLAHAGAGATILSGDELVCALARSLAVDRVGLCSTVPGVLDENDAVIDQITDFDQVAAVLGASDAPDVTGGMAGKVRTLLDLPLQATIFGLADVEQFLDGEAVGTTVRGRQTG